MSKSKAREEVSGLSSNESYCKRLVELAFPVEVWIEGHRYTEATLKTHLETSDGFLERLAGLCFLKARVPAGTAEAQKEWQISQVLASVFPKSVPFGEVIYLRDELYSALLKSPKLQQDVASRRYYMPSKWLVEQERIARKGPAWAGDIYEAVAREELTGVCFSGGGIRSATFNLGVIQGLAQLGLLPHIEYLSSVSGGGYIHEFLAGWILRNGNQHSVVRELIPQSEPGCLPRAPEPIQWLKRYASYLTPTRGFFSTDTWTMLAIWFRNMLLNQVPLLASFGVGLFLLHLLVPMPIWHDASLFADASWLWWLTGVPALIFAGWSLTVLCRNMLRQEAKANAPVPVMCLELLSNVQVVRSIILPWLTCAVWISYWVYFHPYLLWGWPLAPVAIVACLMLIAAQIIIFAGGALDAYRSYHPKGDKPSTAALYAFAGLAATAVACGLGWLFVVGGGALSHWLVDKIGILGQIATQPKQSLQFTVSGLADHLHATLEGSLQPAPPMRGGVTVDLWRVELTLLPGPLLSLPYVAIELTLGLLGRDYRDMQREWLARLRAWSVLYALLWSGIVGIALLGPYLGYWLGSKGATLQWSAAIGFVVAHLTTVLGGASGKADGKPTENGILGYKPLDLVALIAAPFACISLLLVLSYAASVGVDSLAAWLKPGPLFGGSQELSFVAADLECLFAMLAIALIMGRRVDINEFSMHTFYKNRLSRCYLGAVRPGRRSPDPFTGFDNTSMVTVGDRCYNLPPFVSELLPRSYTRDHATQEKGDYDGPFPIFCATLNLTTGEDLATQERKGTSFAFTPLLSGYTVEWTDGEENNHVSFNGYVPTDTYAYPKSQHNARGGIHVDSAVAISGAAANPNMGYNSNPALAFLMTLFNVRLGWWISNPRRMDMWRAENARATPRFALWHLFRELFGAVGDSAAYVNLSDGGHFENMGLYELVRRRCKFILVCDAESDSDMTFGGMGMAITKCRADFGAEIDLDLRPLRIDPATGYSKAHCVVGTIQYPPPWASATGAASKRTACECLEAAEKDLFTGIIVYMKSSLVGDEPADLLAYQLKSPTFPQDSTANQWFTESMFEAYRRLGHHVAMTTMKPALPPLQTGINARNQIAKLFERMYALWYPRTPEMDKYLADHIKQYESLLTEMRQSKELANLEAALNDPRTDEELHLAGLGIIPWAAPADLAPGAAIFATQFANVLFDFMYTVYTDLQLAFPDNRVSPHAEWWICLFRRWCRVNLMQESWKTHIPTLPTEFRLFARRELGLPHVPGFIE